MDKEQLIARTLKVHHPKFRIAYDTGSKVWECSHHECQVKGTIDHIIEHQAEEIVKVLP